MKFRLISDENEGEKDREFISEGDLHFVKKPLPPVQTQKKSRFNFFSRKRI
ncbi:MAG: hypothetical protein NWE84_01765 [Candidatus Bathyarchaeota archaeon]|nr:hypothetical protein [Candidatus Bathyarchaeota archaeon]